MIFIKIIIKISIISLLIIASYVYYQVSVFKIAKLFIKQDKKVLSNRVRIIQISDYHNNNLINKTRLIKEIERLNADIIVLTGDIIDSKTDNFDKTIELLESIKRVNNNIYSVSGNHELKNDKRQEFESRLEMVGVYNLNYKYQTVTIGEDKINLCGIPYYRVGQKKELYFKNLNENLFTILLSHSPKKALEYEDFKSDLILSGHIHGGQVRVPILGALVSPEGGFFPKHNKGLYNIENKKLYIDSGLGNSTIQVRTLNRVQISLIEIE